jgi:hypothetical protein
MSYHLCYDNIEKNIRLYIVKIIYNKINKNTFTLHTCNTLCKVINKLLNNSFFKSNIIKILLSYNNSSFIYNNIIKNIKCKFIKSLQLTIFNINYGIYLLKFYYIQFYILYSYQLCIKFICNKIYQKSKNNINRKISNNFSNNLLYYNISDINKSLIKINEKYKFSYNDDNNYNLLNDIISTVVNNMKIGYIISYNSFILYQNEKNIFLKFLKNIDSLNKNIIFIQKVN